MKFKQYLNEDNMEDALKYLNEKTEKVTTSFNVFEGLIINIYNGNNILLEITKKQMKDLLNNKKIKTTIKQGEFERMI